MLLASKKIGFLWTHLFYFRSQGSQLWWYVQGSAPIGVLYKNAPSESGEWMFQAFRSVQIGSWLHSCLLLPEVAVSARQLSQLIHEILLQALEKYNVEKDIAAYIKKEFDKKYNPTWHCIVGRNFGECSIRTFPFTMWSGFPCSYHVNLVSRLYYAAPTLSEGSEHLMISIWLCEV